MSKLTITRGLPGSGKTTWASEMVASDRGRCSRVNRDDIRATMFGAVGRIVFDYATEQAVSAAQQAAVSALLRAGRDVIVDDTTLRLAHARAWADIAVAEGAEFEVRDFDLVPLDVCIERDRQRPDGVGEDVIRKMHLRFLYGRTLPPVTATELVTATVKPYVPPSPDAGHPRAWLVDIDGTLALMDGRSPYDWHRVDEDQPNTAVIELARGLAFAGYHIVLMSGRDEVCRDATIRWLRVHDVPCAALFMRPEGDMRKDAVVKAELFDRYVRDVYNVRGVIDDRAQVVAMWRSMGLTVAQVAEGNF